MISCWESYRLYLIYVQQYNLKNRTLYINHGILNRNCLRRGFKCKELDICISGSSFFPYRKHFVGEPLGYASKDVYYYPNCYISRSTSGEGSVTQRHLVYWLKSWFLSVAHFSPKSPLGVSNGLSHAGVAAPTAGYRSLPAYHHFTCLLQANRDPYLTWGENHRGD